MNTLDNGNSKHDERDRDEAYDAHIADARIPTPWTVVTETPPPRRVWIMGDADRSVLCLDAEDAPLAHLIVRAVNALDPTILALDLALHALHDYGDSSVVEDVDAAIALGRGRRTTYPPHDPHEDCRTYLESARSAAGENLEAWADMRDQRDALLASLEAIRKHADTIQVDALHAAGARGIGQDQEVRGE